MRGQSNEWEKRPDIIKWLKPLYWSIWSIYKLMNELFSTFERRTSNRKQFVFPGFAATISKEKQKGREEKKRTNAIKNLSHLCDFAWLHCLQTSIWFYWITLNCFLLSFLFASAIFLSYFWLPTVQRMGLLISKTVLWFNRHYGWIRRCHGAQVSCTKKSNDPMTKPWANKLNLDKKDARERERERKEETTTRFCYAINCNDFFRVSSTCLLVDDTARFLFYYPTSITTTVSIIPFGNFSIEKNIKTILLFNRHFFSTRMWYLTRSSSFEMIWLIYFQHISNWRQIVIDFIDAPIIMGISCIMYRKLKKTRKAKSLRSKWEAKSLLKVRVILPSVLHASVCVRELKMFPCQWHPLGCVRQSCVRLWRPLFN